MQQHLRPDTYARHTLERYTGSDITEFGEYILLVNFPRYIEDFAHKFNVPIRRGHWSASHNSEIGVSIINFGVGSPSAGIITHCLSYLEHIKAVLMIGMCGGIDDSLEIGDIVLPTASVRDEGTSRHYIPIDVPAMPHTRISRICNEVVRAEKGIRVKSGLMMTTDYRMWEFDDEFIAYIHRHRIIAIDMEIATIFAVAYALNLPAGAIMLVSDMPLRAGGIKNKELMKEVFDKYTELHLQLGLKTIEHIKLSKLD
ncbi:MAG: AMP nucleosidase [Spirochaetes bacterium]|nr:AMP nucleosidase [Spirochaetota bacterium]